MIGNLFANGPIADSKENVDQYQFSVHPKVFFTICGIVSFMGNVDVWKRRQDGFFGVPCQVTLLKQKSRIALSLYKNLKILLCCFVLFFLKTQTWFPTLLKSLPETRTLNWPGYDRKVCIFRLLLTSRPDVV